MINNLFQDLQARKAGLKDLLKKTQGYGWLDAATTETLIKKVETDTLTIGIIGQMKCGKSTFLNSFVFRDTVLPAATEPMTAALSVITYGEKKELKAEFYTPDEWEEQKEQARRDISTAENELDKSKIEAAKHLVEKSAALGSELPQLLGTSRTDTLERLEDYVGAEGKYVAITKCVTVYSPEDYLRGVEIVDTPGFNDPIVSRELRTRQFLRRADVVVMLTYAGRPLDANDSAILTDNVRQCGIGRVIIGINKYDMPFADGDKEPQIRDYVVRQLREVSRKTNDNTLSDLLLKTTPIPLSAEMALLAMLPLEQIDNSEVLRFAFDRYVEIFDTHSQQELLELSHMEQLGDAVKEVATKEKNKILCAKPVNILLAAATEQERQVAKEIATAQDQIKQCSMTDDELDKRSASLEKADRRLRKLTDSLGEDITDSLEGLQRKGRADIEHCVHRACQRMLSTIDRDFGLFTSQKTIVGKLQAEIDDLTDRDLIGVTEQITAKAKQIIEAPILEYVDEVEEKLADYLPDFDSRDVIRKAKEKIQLTIDDDSLFAFNLDERMGGFGLSDAIAVGSGIFGLIGLALGRLLSHGMDKSKLKEQVRNLEDQFDAEPYIDAAFSQKDEIIDDIRQMFVEEIITPLQRNLQEVRAHNADRAKKKAEAEQRLHELENQQTTLAQQTAEVRQLCANYVEG